MAKAKKEQAIRELEILYTYRTKVLHRDRPMFFDDIQDHMEQPTRSIRQWLNMYHPLILKSAKDAHVHDLLSVRPLTHYFG